MELYLYDDLYSLEEKHWWHIAKRKAVLKLLSKFVKSKKIKILDIGCGTGRNVEVFQGLGITFGLDSSNEAIKFCQIRGLKNIKLGSSDKTGLPGQSYEVVTLLDVLEHVDDSKTLKEVSRVLKPKGLVVITIPALPGLWSQWDEVLHHKRRYTKQGLTKILIQNGFKPLKISYMYSYLVVPAFVIRFFKSILFKSKYPSDFKVSVPFINWLLGKASALELSVLLKWGMPFGTSIISVAQKDEN